MADPPTIPRALDRTLPTIEANLALDEALLIDAEERGGGAVLRFWEPDAPAVVLGASSRLHEDVNVEGCRAEGVAIARRSSGGGTVLVGPGTLNVTVVLGADAGPGLGAVDTAQIVVLERIAEALRAAGPEVKVQGSGDLTIGDRKFAGSAQRRLRRCFLVHACLIYAMPLEPITRLTRLPRRQPAYRVGRDHHDFLTRVPLTRASLVTAISSGWGAPAPDPEQLLAAEDLVGQLLAEKFLADGWVGRF